MSPRWSGIDSAVGAALLDELSESPLPGARYAREVVRRRLPDVLNEARAVAVAPVLEALRLIAADDEKPGVSPSAISVRRRNIARAALKGFSAPSLRPSGEPEPGGLDVRRVAKAIENVAARHGIKKDPPAPLSLARIYGYSAAPAEMDAEIAAEYARLTPERPAEEAAMIAGLQEDAERDRALVAEWEPTLPPLEAP